MKDYSKTVIYLLRHKDDRNVENGYIGSSTDITKRMNKHKSDCNCPNSKSYNQKLYKHIRENGGWDNWVIIELQKYSCNNKQECEARERYWYDKIKGSLNTYKPRLNENETNRYQFDENYRLKTLNNALRRYYNLREDPEFLKQRRDRDRERYQNDPIYREKIKTKNKKFYQNKKMI